jgi:biopolymer transport protein ExbD
MMTISSSRETQCMADINITPFTDVLLVLLIIFIILAAVAAPPGFQKQLSNPRPKPILDPPLGSHQILVEVTAKDRVSLDGKPILFAQIYQMMAATIALHDRHGYSRHIALYADANASYNTIIKILDAARQAGDEDVGFMVQ